jgi:hypothetical protein
MQQKLQQCNNLNDILVFIHSNYHNNNKTNNENEKGK